MIILILAAGYATRLYPLTLNKPKPLLKVGTKPIIDHIFDKILELRDIKNCFIVTNQKFFESFRKWAGQKVSKFGIEVINDKTTSNEDRLGAIRDMEFVIENEKISDDLLVIGGDNLFEFDLKEFVSFSKSHKQYSSLALFDIKNMDMAKIYGVVKIDGSNKVVDFKEKPSQPDSTLIATCVYWFPKERLGLISDFLSSGNKTDAPGNYIKWLSENDRVYGFVFKEAWYDIGDIKSLKEADGKYGKEA